MYFRLGGGNGSWSFYIPEHRALAQGAVTCTVYPLGATAKSSLLSAPSAWKWGSLALSSLYPILPGSVPSPSHSWFQCSASSPTHSPSGTLPSTSPGQGRCLQLSCLAGEDIKVTKLLPYLCPASASLPVSQFASWKMMSTGCSRGCWLSSTCLGPAETQTPAPILFWEGAFVTSLPDPASLPLFRNSYSCSENSRESQQKKLLCFPPSFLSTSQNQLN